MSHIRRLIFSGSLLFMDALAAVMYVRMILPLAEYSRDGGQFSGPMSPAVELLVYIVGLVLGVIALVALLYPIVGAVREESARQRGRVPR